jgi:hypothetical protein
VRDGKPGPTLLALLSLLCLWGCTPRTPIQKAGQDQEIARDIHLELRKDARFEHVNAFCVDYVVTLEGRVSSKAEEAEAVRIAGTRARGAPLYSRLEIRPR